MGAIKINIIGSDYVGAFATANDNHVFVGNNISKKSKELLEETLEVSAIPMSIFGSDLVGIFSRSNSNGIAVSNLIFADELQRLKKEAKDINVGVIQSDLNALGSNILANDKIAIVNPKYGGKSIEQIKDILGVEVIKQKIGNFYTVGANNILTNKGFVINNKATDKDKEQADKITGFNSMSSTANTGSLSVGLATITNSKGIVAGETTTGYELTRMTESLNIE
jgi:translation initiation factor 6